MIVPDFHQIIRRAPSQIKGQETRFNGPIELLDNGNYKDFHRRSNDQYGLS